MPQATVEVLNGWLSRVLVTVVAGGVLAGFSGLVIAGSMRATVSHLEDQSARDHVKINSTAEDVAALKVLIAEVKEQMAVQRLEQRQDNTKLGAKLDRVLERLPPS